MAIATKYAANEALKVIDDDLARELNIYRFDAKNRTKAQLFAVNGAQGKQFGIVLGNTDVRSGHHPAQQTRILLERCEAEKMDGVEPTPSAYNGHRIKNNLDSKIAAPNQSSFLVSDEQALKRLLRWYSQNK